MNVKGWEGELDPEKFKVIELFQLVRALKELKLNASFIFNQGVINKLINGFEKYILIGGGFLSLLFLILTC